MELPIFRISTSHVTKQSHVSQFENEHCKLKVAVQYTPTTAIININEWPTYMQHIRDSQILDSRSDCNALTVTLFETLLTVMELQELSVKIVFKLESMEYSVALSHK
jgi:hypothetical protein